MVPAAGSLAGRVVFITGASRGIGKAIALRCAQDGAKVVIAAKTVVAHPKLPGTIYTAAKELEAVGGQCLPCEVDIRDEEQVKLAVEKTVAQFGGIDILVNNASAIQLTGTEETPMKRYDLMMGVNARGTYVCSKYCIPHLKKAPNPHILNISPPLSMKSKWFKNHVAYTMAKYGMSMCALGMADELKEIGIAVNALWPRTAIYTAAMEMLGGGSQVKESCRSPEIMADAAYAILTKNSRDFTGKFCIDDEVLKNEGISDFSKYNYCENARLILDFFLEDNGGFSNITADFTAIGEETLRSRTAGGIANKPPSSTASPAGGLGEKQGAEGKEDLSSTFKAIEGLMSEELVKSIGGVYQFDLKGDKFYIDLKNGRGEAARGDSPSKVDCTMTLDSADFVKMFAGQLNPTTAFMGGKLKIKGDLGLAMKLEKLLKQTKSKL